MSSVLQRTAAVLIIGGALVLVGYGVYAILKALFQSDEVPLAISLAAAAIVLGFAILVIYVVLDRFRESRHERFEEADE